MSTETTRLESIIHIFVHIGLVQKELDKFLASNVVLDWFGRTFSGKKSVIDFYFNLNNTYEHSVTNVQDIQPFESRKTHMSTREEPEENFCSPLISSEACKHDCDTSVDLNGSQITPPKRSVPVGCPNAPCKGPYRNNLSSDEDDSDTEVDSDIESDIETGITPLDPSLEMLLTKKNKEDKRKEKDVKRPRVGSISATDDTRQANAIERESNFSELYYLEAAGTVTCNCNGSSSPVSSHDSVPRECKLLISYRLNKSNEDDIQIALIMYIPNKSNQKTRVNLLHKFVDTIITKVTPRTSTTPSGVVVASESPGNKSTKRAKSSRCLRL